MAVPVLDLIFSHIGGWPTQLGTIQLGIRHSTTALEGQVGVWSEVSVQIDGAKKGCKVDGAIANRRATRRGG